MATKTANSSSRLVIIGALVLVVGIILVLLVLRGGGEAASAAASDGAEAAATDVGDGEAVAQAAPPAMSVEELSSSRLPLPPQVPVGYEAVAVKASFVRGLAAIPSPGDLVNLYRAASREEGSAEAEEAELVLGDLEVLALIGPLPTQNEGEVTFLLAVEQAHVPSLLPVASSAELWFTLLPGEAAEELA